MAEARSAVKHDAVLREMGGRACTMDEMADATGLTRRQVRQYLESRDIPRRKRDALTRLTKEVQAQIADAVNGGMTRTAACKKFNLSWKTVARACVAAEVPGAWHAFLPEEDAVLRASEEKKLAVPDIVGLLPGRSAGSIAARASLLGLSLGKRFLRPRHGSAVVESVRVTAPQCSSVREIATKLGLTVGQVHGIMHRNDIPAVREPSPVVFTPEMVVQMREMAAAGSTTMEIAIALRGSSEFYVSVYRCMTRHGIKTRSKVPPPAAPPPPTLVVDVQLASKLPHQNLHYIQCGTQDIRRYWIEKMDCDGHPDLEKVNAHRAQRGRVPFRMIGGPMTGQFRNSAWAA